MIRELERTWSVQNDASFLASIGIAQYDPDGFEAQRRERRRKRFILIFAVFEAVAYAGVLVWTALN